MATVNATNPATTIPELLNALTPVSSAELIEFQSILADCVAAQNAASTSAAAALVSQNAAAASAATLDLINDLSQAYVFATVAEYKSSSILFPVNKRIYLADRDAYYSVLTSVTTGTDIVVSTTVSQSLKLVISRNLSLQDFGTPVSGLVDSSAIAQSVIDFAVTFGSGSLVPYRRSGMEVFVGNGCYKLESQIEGKQGIVNFVGNGRFQNYPQKLEISSEGLPVFMPVHTGRGAFHFTGDLENSKINFKDLSIATLETGDRPTSALAFESGTEFMRDYTFENVGIYGFNSACDIYGAGGTGYGILKFINCAINRNDYIFRCLDNQICNGLIIDSCEIGQNNVGGMDIKGHAVNIVKNIFESNTDTIKVQGSYRGLVIKGNYFEANDGNYITMLIGTKGAEIGPNFYGNTFAKVPLFLFKDRDTIVNETDVTPCVEGSWDPKVSLGLFSLNNSDYQQKGASVAMFWNSDFIKTQISQGVTEIGTVQLTNPSGFHKNIPNSAGSLRTSSGTGIITFNQAGLSVPADTWVGVAVLVTYDEQIEEFPRMKVRLNNGTADGFHDGQFAEYDNTTSAGTDKLGNRTVLYTVYAKSLATITSVQTQLYPWGVSPTAGLTAVTSAPFVFTTPSNTFKPFIPQEFVSSTSIPSSSNFPQGWKVFNKDPLAGEYEGWLHVDGSGTWRGFGLFEV